MNNNHLYHQFINRNSISKTIRFALIPQRETLEHIEAGAFLSEDERRAQDYINIKPLIDEYHKQFIDASMESVKEEALAEAGEKEAFAITDLEQFATSYAAFKKARQASKGKDLNKAKKQFEAACTALRKKLVARSFNSPKNKATFTKLFKKELFTELLAASNTSEDKLKLIEQFQTFSSYFTGFHENRKNLYTDEDKATAIAYRLVNENLVKYLDNIELYKKYQSQIDLLLKTHYGTDGDKIQLFKDSFTLSHYLGCLTQAGITRYNGNLGGFTQSDGKKLQGINEFINLHNQKLTNKKERIPSFKMLFKQILSDRESLSFLPEGFTSSTEMYESISALHKNLILNNSHPLATQTGSLLGELTLLYKELAAGNFDTEKIYIHQSNLRKVSSHFYGRHHVISDALLSSLSAANQKLGADKLTETLEKISYHSLASLQAALCAYAETLDDASLAEKLRRPIIEEFISHFEVIINEKIHTYHSALDAYYSSLKGELETEHDLVHRPSKKTIADIKTYMDCWMDMIHYVKLLSLQRKDLSNYELDANFYDSYTSINEELFLVTRLYDKIRNYATKKPYSEKKFKLNFNSVTFLNGWAQSNEHANLGILFKKNGMKYMGIINRKAKYSRGERKALFSQDKITSNSDDFYEKMEYNQLTNPSRDIPSYSIRLNAVKKHFSTGNASDFIIDSKSYATPLRVSKEIMEIYPDTKDKSKCKCLKAYLDATGDVAGFKDAKLKWLQFCINFLKSYKTTSLYDLSNIKPLDQYEDIMDFYDDINKVSINITFKKFSSDYIHQLIKEGKLLLFQISNKDYQAGATGTPNLHTLYWNACFSPENLALPQIKLNGEAELFYRRRSIVGDRVVTHKKSSILVNKTTVDGEAIPESAYHELVAFHSGKLEDEKLSTLACAYKDKIITKQATHDIIKDRRYTRDQFLFHVPLTFNFQAEGKANINEAVTEAIKINQQVNIIGIDRGERHLLYLTVIDQNGKILEQRSLNTLCGSNQQEVDYHSKLHAREQERDHARKAWGNIEQIAQLKEGYLSHVIHEICTLAEKYQAIIVLEDLNFGFKRGRFKVEKQVYQKFEKALITKLNYLCFKNREPQSAGSITYAYQLTSPFVSFREIGKQKDKQNGILFYLPAAHTSKIDPVTGFVDRLKPRYQNRQQASEFFAKMESISYNEKDKCFDFCYEEKKYVSTGNKKWTVKTWGDIRYRWNKKANNNKGATESIHVTNEMCELLQSKGIDPKSTSLKQQLENSDDASLLRKMMSLLALVLSMRYSYGEIDYIISPVAFAQGQGYDSRKHGERLPVNADANGAYNIARKGLLMLKRMHADEKNAKIIKNEDWFTYVQSDDVVKIQRSQT